MHSSIVNSRTKAPENVYVAVPSASSDVANLPIDDDWEDFAVLFRSIDFRYKKPDCAYFITIFTGEDRQGHWTFVVLVHKSYTSWRMWIMDILGGSGSARTSPIIRSIKMAFSRAKISQISHYEEYMQTTNRGGMQSAGGGGNGKYVHCFLHGEND